MPQDLYHYDAMVENALRMVVREALGRAAKEGLRGAHHFYVGFRTRAPGVTVPEFLLSKYPDEMTIVLQHQFWDLEVTESEFSVLLSFQNQPERITVPFAAITAFADPSVKFALQFTVAEAPATGGVPAALPAAKTSLLKPAPQGGAKTGGAKASAAKKNERPAAEIVALDKFRKR